jgi:PAS domain S-box-containing protein
VEQEEQDNILLVGSRKENLLALEAVLDHRDYHLFRAESCEEALKALHSHEFAVVLLDVEMPNMDGFEVASRIRQSPTTARTPILFLAANSRDESYIAITSKLGTVDFLFKPFDASILKAKVAVFVDLYRSKREVARQGELLRLQEKNFRTTVLDKALDAMVAVDHNDKVIDWNSQAEKIFGWSKAEVLGQPMSALIIPPEHREAHKVGMQHFRETGKGPIINRRVELEALRRDGSRFPVELTVIPISVNSDCSFYSFIRDISEQKRTTRELVLKSDALENSLNGFDIVNGEGKFIYANRAYLKMWGYDSLDEILGTSPANHCADPSTPLTIIRTLKERGECDIEFLARRKDGSTFDVHMWARLAYDADGNEIYPTTSIDISAKKQAERERLAAQEKVQAEQTKYRDLVEGIDHSVIWSADPESLTFTFVSPRAYELTGYPVKQWYEELGFWANHLHPDDKEWVIEAFRKAYQERKDQGVDHRFIKADGGVLWFHTGVRLAKKGEGAGFELRGLSADITQIKQAEHQLKLVTNTAPAFISYIDTNERYRFANETYENWFGLSANAIKGKSVRELLGETTYSRVKPHLDCALQGKVVNFETNLSSKGGVTLTLNTIYAPDLDDLGKVRGLVVLSTDITERKLAEQKLGKAEKNAVLLSEATATLIADLDFQARLNRLVQLIVPVMADWCVIDLVNQEHKLEAVAAWHRNPNKRHVVHEYRTKFPPRPEASVGVFHVIRSGKIEYVPHVSSELLEKAATNAEHLHYLRTVGLSSYICLPLKAHGRTLGAISIIMTAESNRYFTEDDLNFATLLADRAALAIDNALLYQRAQEAIQARDEFISICSHELKTPLTSMKLQFQMAEKQIRKGSPAALSKEVVEKRVTTANRQLDRMTQLIEEMLDVSRIATGRLPMNRQAIDLYDLVQEVLERFTEQFAALGIALHFESRPIAVSVLGDRYRLEQVVANLLTNAVKYGSGKPVEVKVEIFGESAWLSVKDYGIGIAKESLDRIFNRFERAISASNISGLGLGLYISRQIVEAHEGRIWAESELGKGSSFTVELPLATQAAKISHSGQH